MKKSDLTRILGYRLEGRMDMQDRINAELAYVQANALESNAWLPWFLWKEETLTFPPSFHSIPLPVDFLMEAEGDWSREGSVWRILPDGHFQLMKKEAPAAVLRHGLRLGTPGYYAVLQDKLIVAPACKQGEMFTLYYYGKDADMATAGEEDETLWMQHASDLVIALVGKELATKHIQNEVLAGSFAQDAQVAWDGLLRKHTAMEEVNVNRQSRGHI
jgi:hypothetical protein